MWTILYEAPWLAFAIGMQMFSHAFLLAWKGGWSLRSIVIRLTGIGLVWVLYGIYEYKMKGWEMTVRNPIRVDLLMILPVLQNLAGFGTLLWIWGQVLVWLTPGKK